MADPDSTFAVARAETLRYHRDLYATTQLGQHGTWLAAPQQSVLDAIAEVDATRPAVAYDLGAGVGRHTIPMLQMLALGSTVVAVDILPEALEALRANSPETRSRLRLVTADLADFEFEEPADLIVAFSAIEHLPDLDSIQRMLERIAAVTTRGGIVHFGFVCDRYEIDHAGHRRPALLESRLSSGQAMTMVEHAFSAFDTVTRSKRPATVSESRNGEGYDLASTLVSYTLRRP